LQEAEACAHDDSLDFFLTVIAIVKERAIEAELDDAPLFEFERVFDFGDEDAYSLRPYDPDRLHDHVERTKDECWRLQVVRVVDPPEQPLGWSVCAVLYANLSSEATDADIACRRSRAFSTSTVFTATAKRSSSSTAGGCS
jgi:hypothetical protein